MVKCNFLDGKNQCLCPCTCGCWGFVCTQSLLLPQRQHLVLRAPSWAHVYGSRQTEEALGHCGSHTGLKSLWLIHCHRSQVAVERHMDSQWHGHTRDTNVRCVQIASTCLADQPHRRCTTPSLLHPAPPLTHTHTHTFNKSSTDWLAFTTLLILIYYVLVV